MEYPLVPFGKYRVPGDSGPPWHMPEIVACESRILTLADGLFTWMREVKIDDPEYRARLDAFMTAHGNGLQGYMLDPPKQHVLDTLDPDANRLFFELMRAAWERRAWQMHYGVRVANEL